MPKVIVGETITLSAIALRSVMLYPGVGDEIQVDICYDVLQDNGVVYEEAKHLNLPVPPALEAMVLAQWQVALANAQKAEGI